MFFLSSLVPMAAVYLGLKFTGPMTSSTVSAPVAPQPPQSTISTSNLFGWAAVLFAGAFFLQYTGKLFK